MERSDFYCRIVKERAATYVATDVNILKSLISTYVYMHVLLESY